MSCNAALSCFVALALVGATDQRAAAMEPGRPAASLQELYVKRECSIPMRDGVRLFTAIYSPRSQTRTSPIMLRRTPYGCHPYGETRYAPLDAVSPSPLLVPAGYVFVVQDVRGCFMSEGEWVHMRPFAEHDGDPSRIDESTDAFDTIAWLLDNVSSHNGRVGMWGASYPGFYAAAALVDSHPALKAVSPAAPQADWFFEDVHQNGAFRLADVFGFLAELGWPRAGPGDEEPSSEIPSFDDAYRFFLDLGPISNINRLYFRDRIAIWNEIIAHPDYDDFWQKRNLLPHLRNARPATLTVGGWFDESNLYGSMNVFETLRASHPRGSHSLVVGPWQHTGWETDDDAFGDVRFGRNTGLHFQREMLVPFFERHLREDNPQDEAAIHAFDTGVHEWRRFDAWPPRDARPRGLFLHADGMLADARPADHDRTAFNEYVSDPVNPVPFTAEVTADTPARYMTEDQHFAACRPDVLVYRTERLEEDISAVGPVTVDLWVSTSETAADWVVKIIDVHPAGDAERPSTPEAPADHEMLVRAGVLRGRFRESFTDPKPFIPGRPTRVSFDLLDVCHTFRRGHRVMVQIQSSWFPLIDRNPQTYVANIFSADALAFVPATHRVYCSEQRPSQIRLTTLQHEEHGSAPPRPLWDEPRTVAGAGRIAGPPAVVDVNADGHPDLVVLSADPHGGPAGQLVVFLGDGLGDFRRRGGGTGVPFPGRALWLAAGDVNEDGRIDAVVGHHDSYGLAVLLGAGNGDFGAPAGLVMAHHGPDPHTHALVLSDVNGDAHLDVVSTCADDNAVAVLLGDGAGAFEPAPGSPFDAGNQPYEGVSVALFDGDTLPDIAVPNLWGSAASVLLGDGRGRFRQAPNSPIAVGPRPGFVAVGDLNNDGLADMVVTHDDDPVVDLLLGDGKGGMAAAPGSPIHVGQPVWEAVVADVDRDGDNDVVLGGSRDQVMVLIGDGRGGVRGRPLAIRTPRSGPGRVRVVDLNGDERPDLVVTYYDSNVVDVYFGTRR